MTIASDVNRNDYTGNGTTEVYSYTFAIFEASDLRVTVRDDDGLETLLVLTTDYTVSGAGEVGGGSITLVDSNQDWLDAEGDLKTDYALTIRRVRPITQETDIRNQGDFFPEVHENAFDHIVMVAQQMQDELDRCLKLPETISGEDFDTLLPTGITDSARLAIVTKADGTGLELGPTTEAIEDASANAVAAAASATAAASSATSAAASATSATASASSATTSASAASTSATAAASSATAAASSATSASTSATNAATSASGASTSATNAATSASSAVTAKNAAEAAQALAEAAASSGVITIPDSNDASTGNVDALTTTAHGSIRLTGAVTNLRGLANGADGRIVFVINSSGSDITVKNQDANPTATNRIITGSGADATLTNGGIFIFKYDSTTGRWRMTGGSGGTINDGTVTNAKLADMAQSTIKGRAAGAGTGAPVDLTATQATAILNVFGPDSGAGGVKGLVPATVAGDATKVLYGDGTWSTPGAGVDLVYFRGYIAGTVSPSDTDPVQFDSGNTDPQGGWNATTDLYTIPAAGYYYIGFNGYQTGSSLAYAGIELHINGSNAHGANLWVESPQEATTFARTISGVHSQLFAAGDTIALKFDVNGAPTIAHRELVIFRISGGDGTSVDTDWTAYTPTFTGFGTVTSPEFQYRREGSDLLIRGKATLGTPTAVEARISLPGGLTSANTSKIPSIQKAGDVVFSVNSGAQWNTLIEPSVTYLTWSQQSGSSNGLLKLTGTAGGNSSGDIIYLDARVPIQGWAPSAGLSTITSWVAYTPTITNFGTVGSVSFNSRRVGSNLEVLGHFESGTTAGAIGSLTMGYNGVNGTITADVNIVPAAFSGLLTKVGDMTNSAQTDGTTCLAEGGSNLIKFGSVLSSLGLTPVNASGAIGNTKYVSVSFSVPITGWN